MIDGAANSSLLHRTHLPQVTLRPGAVRADRGPNGLESVVGIVTGGPGFATQEPQHEFTRATLGESCAETPKTK